MGMGALPRYENTAMHAVSGEKTKSSPLRAQRARGKPNGDSSGSFWASVIGLALSLLQFADAKTSIFSPRRLARFYNCTGKCPAQRSIAASAGGDSSPRWRG